MMRKLKRETFLKVILATRNAVMCQVIYHTLVQVFRYENNNGCPLGV